MRHRTPTEEETCSTGHDRQIGRFAWVMAWVGLVVGQLHALARLRDRRRQGGPRRCRCTAAWAEPAADALRAAARLGRPRPRLRHLREDLVPGVPGVHAVRLRRLPAPAADGLREVGVAARAHRRTSSRASASSWTTGPSGPATTTATGSRRRCSAWRSRSTFPALLLTLLGSTLLGVTLLVKRFRPVLPALLLALMIPLAFGITAGHVAGQRRAAGHVRVRHPRPPDRAHRRPDGARPGPRDSDGVRRELAGEVLVGPAADEGPVGGVLHRGDLAVLVEPVDQVAALVGQQRLELDVRAGAARPRRPRAPRRCPRRSWR